jgi:hypothetical protein
MSSSKPIMPFTMEYLTVQLHNMAATLADVLGKVTSNTAWLTDLDDTVVGLSTAVFVIKEDQG